MLQVELQGNLISKVEGDSLYDWCPDRTGDMPGGRGQGKAGPTPSWVEVTLQSTSNSFQSVFTVQSSEFRSFLEKVISRHFV